MKQNHYKSATLELFVKKNSISSIYLIQVLRSMKNNTSIAILGIALAIVGGMFAANASGLIGFKSTDNKAQAGAYMTGHVETILRDADGNIKEYRQSDNLISNTGENCTLRLLFGTTQGSGTGTNVCTGALTSPWHVIALGTGGATAVNGTQVGLTTETAVSGLGRSIATTKTWTNSTASASTGSAQIVMAKTFTNGSGGTVTVSESGLFNSTSIAGSGMFARQTFSGIAVNNGDSLTVQWTVNVGGTSYTLQQFS
jgi:hypothetical protein